MIKNNIFGISALSLLTSLNSFAQPESSSPRVDRVSSRMLEEVVFTAQKREENTLDVPISIAAYGAEKLDAMGVGEVRQLDKITPGLTFTEIFGYTVV